MYWEDRWTFKNSVEYEYKWAGRYGAGEQGAEADESQLQGK